MSSVSLYPFDSSARTLYQSPSSMLKRLRTDFLVLYHDRMKETGAESVNAAPQKPDRKVEIVNSRGCSVQILGRCIKKYYYPSIIGRKNR